MNLPGLRGHLIHCWNTQTEGLALRRARDAAQSLVPVPVPASPAQPRGSSPAAAPAQTQGRPRPPWGLARKGAMPGGPARPHLGSFTVRSTLRSCEASRGPGAPALSPGSGFSGAGVNLAGLACCPFPTGEGRGDAVRGAGGSMLGTDWSPLGGGQRGGWAGAPGEPRLLVSDSPH